MCISKCLSYCYNYYYIKNNDTFKSIKSIKDIDSKEDKWIRFKKIEGFCNSCYKYSYLLSIIDKDSKNAICYRCFTDYTD